MKSALLHYPYDEVFRFVDKVCQRNGFRIHEINKESGEVIANRGYKLLGNKSRLHLKLERKAKLITKVNVEIMRERIKKNPAALQKMEEEIIDTIYKYF